MTEKDTFIKWMNESGLEKVYEELEKILEVQLLELQAKKPNKYKELVEWEKIVNSQKNNVRCQTLNMKTDPEVQKEMDKMVSMYRDFDPEDIIITKNETELDEVQFF